MTKKTWLGIVVFFFAWGFVMHAVGLLLHELGGHALASALLACGIDGMKLTLFGHGEVYYAPCTRWTLPRILVANWAGLAITIAAGIAAAVTVIRRRELAPITRLLVGLVAFFFLLGQLGYATAGGFHGLYDPGRTARLLAARGLQFLVWGPALVAYAVAASVCARAVVDAFREQFGSRSRLHGLGQMLATLGVSGALYWVAFRIEWQLRTDVTMRGVRVEAERRAVARNAPPPFPIELVLLAVAVLAIVWALARPLPAATASARPIPRSHVLLVASATVVSAVVLVALSTYGRPR